MAISDNQRDDNADTRQKNQPDSVISNGVWYHTKCTTIWVSAREEILVRRQAIHGRGNTLNRVVGKGQDGLSASKP